MSRRTNRHHLTACSITPPADPLAYSGMALLTGSSIEANETYTVKTFPGGRYLLGLAGNFGGGTLTVSWISDAGDSVPIAVYSSAGERLIDCPSHAVSLTLANATNPRISVTLVPAANQNALPSPAEIGAMAEFSEPNTLYIRSNGNDGAAVIGRRDLPFATFQAAYDRVVSDALDSASVTYDIDGRPGQQQLFLARDGDTLRIHGAGIDRTNLMVSGNGAPGVEGTQGTITIGAVDTAFNTFVIYVLDFANMPTFVSVGIVGSGATAQIPVPSTAAQAAAVISAAGLYGYDSDHTFISGFHGGASVGLNSGDQPDWVTMFGGVESIQGSPAKTNITLLGHGYSVDCRLDGGDSMYPFGTGNSAGTVAMARGDFKATFHAYGGAAPSSDGPHGDVTADGIIIAGFTGNSLTTARCYLRGASITGGHIQLGGDTNL